MGHIWLEEKLSVGENPEKELLPKPQAGLKGSAARDRQSRVKWVKTVSSSTGSFCVQLFKEIICS